MLLLLLLPLSKSRLCMLEPVCLIHTYMQAAPTYMQAYTRTGTSTTTLFLILFVARMSRTLAYFFKCLRLLIGRRCYSRAALPPLMKSDMRDMSKQR